MVQAGSQDTRGSGAPPDADVQDDLQGHVSAFSALSLSPQSICGMGEVGGWGHMVAYLPLGEQRKGGPSALCSFSHCQRRPLLTTS